MRKYFANEAQHPIIQYTILLDHIRITLEWVNSAIYLSCTWDNPRLLHDVQIEYG